MGIILLITTAYILSLKYRYKFLYLPLVILFVFINFNFRDYNLKAFDGQVIGKVVLSNENKSIIKTESLNRKKFKTKVLVYEKLERGEKYKVHGKFYPPLPAMNRGPLTMRRTISLRGFILLER